MNGKVGHGLCIFGEVLFDIFPDGTHVLGGAPFNVAWHLQAFGRDPYLISSVGDDAEGTHIRDAMAGWGMAQGGLETDKEHPTGRVTVSLEAGEPTYDIVDHCAYDYINLDGKRARPACRLLYHGSLALRNSVSAESLERLKASKPQTVFVDVNLRAPWWSRERVLDLVRGADWVKLNRDELALLSGSTGPLAEQARDFASEYGLGGLILTLGAQGALGFNGDGELAEAAPPPSLEVVDAVGAGDAFASVLILGIDSGWPLGVTLERAQQFASRVVRQRGATVADPELYRPFVEDWGLKSP